ncbi:hypothetical protein LCGC14_1453160 [marine sediment metagenome]|uniref:Uncharacterized protein n=1 Tax=marine sediment metagenome TaxID=412755 RepID=A0A0F9MJ26_9ZZZZ
MEPDLSKLPPTPLSKAWLEAQEKIKETESEGAPVKPPTEETPQPGLTKSPEILVPVDPKELLHLKYTRPLPGSYRTFSIDLYTTENEINNTVVFRAKCLAAIVGEKIFIETVDEHAQDIRPLSGISKPPPDVEDKPKSTTGRTCDLCGSDLVFKKGFNEEKKKAWAAWFCSKAGPDIDASQRCSKGPQWISQKKS